jgi:hypothetical protein
MCYHFALFELVRPIILGGSTAQPDGTERINPPAFAISARDASIKALRQLLVRREALYGGLGINALFSSPACAVIFEAMPTASPSSPGYTPSAHMAFLTGLRLLMHLSRSIHVVYYGVLGVQQAASRSAFHVPVEADKIFEEAAKALDNNPWQEKSRKQVLSDWVVDLSRPTPDDASGRLGNLVAEMDHMAIKDDKQDR